MSFFDDIFGGGSSKYFDEASDEFKKYSQQSLADIAKSRAEGRSDLATGRERALGYQQPYLQGGQQSLAALLDSLGIGAGAKGEQGIYSKFTNSPGYQFALKQGQQSVEAENAARGLTGSGAEAMQLQQLGQGMAEQSWDKYLKNYQDRLSDLAGMGQRSAFASSDIESQTGRSLADLGAKYSDMDVGVLQSIAKSSSEARLAQGVAKEQTKQSFWKGLGEGFGATAKFAMH